MWLYEKRKYASEKNGEITCLRLFGRWEIFVGGYHESSRYMVSVWRKAYRQLPTDFAPREILLLGLAGGDNVVLLNERFPGCRVTAVEWDPVMVRVADELRIFPPALRPRIVVADAREAVVTLEGKYDLAFVDLFRGSRVAPSAFTETFLSGLRRLVVPGGLVIANGFLEPELFTAIGRHFMLVSTWRSGYNHLALFRAPLADGVGDAVR